MITKKKNKYFLGRFYYIVKIPLLKEDEKIPLADYGVDIEKGLFFKLNLDDKYIAAKYQQKYMI